MRDENALPFPIAYQALALNGAKGGATKYASLQFLNYARWTAQAESCGVLRALRPLRIVGADVVEVAPAYDNGEVTAVAAANLAYELVSLMADGF